MMRGPQDMLAKELKLVLERLKALRAHVYYNINEKLRPALLAALSISTNPVSLAQAIGVPNLIEQLLKVLCPFLMCYQPSHRQPLLSSPRFWANVLQEVTESKCTAVRLSGRGA
jgi:hypothetical protein